MIEKDILSLRLEAITSAQERSRTAFFSATIAAMVVLIVFFNITFSQGNLTPDLPDKSAHDFVFEALKKEQVKHYFDRFYYSLPLVGVQVSTDDLSLFAPLALLIFSLYYVSCMRSTLNQLQELRRNLGAATDELEREKIAIILNSQVVLNTPTSKLPFETPKRLRVISFAKTINLYRFLIYLPALAGIAALYADIRGTYFAGGAFDPAGVIYFAGLSAQAQAKVILFQLIGLVVTALVILYCAAAATYASQVGEIVTSLTNSCRPTTD